MTLSYVAPSRHKLKPDDDLAHNSPQDRVIVGLLSQPAAPTPGRESASQFWMETIDTPTSSSSTSAPLPPGPPCPMTPCNSLVRTDSSSAARDDARPMGEKAVPVTDCTAEAFFDRVTPTANRRGFDLGLKSWVWDQWVSAYDGTHPLLDVGCGVGTNSVAALQAGASVVALDMEEKHVDAVRERAGEAAVSSGRLRTMVAELPVSADKQEALGLTEGMASAVLCAQVIHFQSPEDFEGTMANLARWVKPGGLVLVLASSIYNKCLLDGHDGGAARMAQMEVEAQAGLYPGWFPDSVADLLGRWFRDDSPETTTPPQGDAVGDSDATWLQGAKEVMEQVLPPCHHFFHPVQLCRVAEASQLEVVSCSLLPASTLGLPQHMHVSASNPLSGKEQAVLVARKPLSDGKS